MSLTYQVKWEGETPHDGTHAGMVKSFESLLKEAVEAGAPENTRPSLIMMWDNKVRLNMSWDNK